jgi:hypothetical protein
MDGVEVMSPVVLAFVNLRFSMWRFNLEDGVESETLGRVLWVRSGRN